MSVIAFSMVAAPEEVRPARELVVAALAVAGVPLDADELADVAVMVSEAVTNGIRYGCDPGRDDQMLKVSVDLVGAGTVRIEVRDPGRGVPRPRPAGKEDEGGRGLLIIRMLASDYGVRIAEDGARTTWFELGMKVRASLAGASRRE
ncbi:ATP-binding protein [Kitasatospora kifunensis]|uniref:Anti-sigma regulatory factor (Ser/Thr protein kinase) n=1 Tax=Kitasatospora kifunensis TaxID=58351 RepID=A0A7W7QXQ3_KITKI|nr:ATP-binding protein [Kitasatospora kifunensis]MBB4921458.1 anti-sigma regulatory factor (Ser/Thr protein kinase) [Kitasatospora kifunensis]